MAKPKTISLQLERRIVEFTPDQIKVTRPAAAAVVGLGAGTSMARGLRFPDPDGILLTPKGVIMHTYSPKDIEYWANELDGHDLNWDAILEENPSNRNTQEIIAALKAQTQASISQREESKAKAEAAINNTRRFLDKRHLLSGRQTFSIDAILEAVAPVVTEQEAHRIFTNLQNGKTL